MNIFPTLIYNFNTNEAFALNYIILSHFPTKINKLVVPG
jgi:hypothetical protein